MLAGDHVYKMDYEQMLQQHVEQRADVTVGCFEVPRMDATAIRRDAHRPQRPHHLVPREAAGSAGHAGQTRPGAGQHGHLRVRNEVPDRAAGAATPPTRTRSHDFGGDIIPRHRQTTATRWRTGSPIPACAPAPEAEPYWRDVGTIDAYWEANIDLTASDARSLDLFDRDWPIWTYGEIVPPAKFVHDVDGRRGQAINSLVSGGCIISGASVRQSLLFTGVHAHSYAEIDGAVILPYVNVSRSARLHNVVIDRGVHDPAGTGGG